MSIFFVIVTYTCSETPYLLPDFVSLPGMRNQAWVHRSLILKMNGRGLLITGDLLERVFRVLKISRALRRCLAQL